MRRLVDVPRHSGHHGACECYSCYRSRARLYDPMATPKRAMVWFALWGIFIVALLTGAYIHASHHPLRAEQHRSVPALNQD